MKSTNIALIGVIVAGLVGASLASASLTTLFLASTQASNMENSPIGMMGHITVIAFDADENIKSYLQSDNQIVDTGENCVAEVLFDVSSVANATTQCTGTGPTAGSQGPSLNGFNFLAIGTNATAVIADQTTLSTEATEARLDAGATGTVSMTVSQGQGVTKAVVTIVDTFTMDGTKTIEEYGLFDASTAGNMFARQTPGGAALTLSDTLQVTWTIDVGS